MRIGYLTSHYPAVSHAFVLREVQALRRAGVEVVPFSIHRAPAEQLLAAADREEAQRTRSALPTGPLRLGLTHLLALLSAPRRYGRTLAFALRRANPGVRGRLWGLFYFAEAMLVWRAARRENVRHLHAVFADVASDVALLVTHFGGADWSWSIAVHGPVEFRDVSTNQLAAKLRHARFAVAISEFGRSQLMTLTDPDRWDRLHVVRCGLDPQAFAGRRTERDPGPPRILCVGRLIAFKGQALLLEAMAELERRGLAAELTLVGDGPQRAELEALAARLGIAGRVQFAGAVGQDAIQAAYRAADIFCLPSMAEGLPVVLMEAMALQVPVITTPVMGIGELVRDGETGLLVTPGRVEPLTDALARLADDPDLRDRLAAAGRARVLAEFDVNASAQRLRTLFSAVGG